MDRGKMFYKYDLHIQLQTAIGSYEQGRQEYWERLSGWSGVEYEQAERFAKAILKNTGQFIAVEEIEGDLSKLRREINESNKRPQLDKKYTEIARSDLPLDKRTALILDVLNSFPPDPRSEESPLKLVWERFVIDMSWEAVEKIEIGTLRIFQLFDLVLNSKPSVPTQQFLARLSRCYIWGFDPECVILCRAVTETAFKDRISPEICEKHFGKARNKYDFTLSDKIQAALNEEIIDEHVVKKARTVKTRGDTAVHRQPDITKNVWGTICDTVAVLERITAGK